MPPRWPGSHRRGWVPAHVSTCNSLAVTVQAIVDGLAIGLVPIRVLRDELARGTVRLLDVSPPIAGHRVSLCHQATQFGPGLRQVLEMVRQLIQEHALFAPPDGQHDMKSD